MPGIASVRVGLGPAPRLGVPLMIWFIIDAIFESSQLAAVPDVAKIEATMPGQTLETAVTTGTVETLPAAYCTTTPEEP
jgi:hypothetical protein